jgi:ribosomal protein L24E
MAVIQKCSFSGRPIAQGTGTMFIRKDGRILYFENMKAQKNFFKLGRKPRETRWTEEFKLEKKSRMAAQAHAAQHKDEVEHADEKPAAKPATKAPVKKTAKKA